MNEPARKPREDRARALETYYQGERYRSRLEAKWAVFFDALGVEAVYESRSFDLDGTPYLPDFYLKDRGVWAEVKPDLQTSDLSKPIALARLTSEPVVVLGDVPRERTCGPHHLLIAYDRADRLTVGWFTWLPASPDIGGVLEEPHGFPCFIGRENRVPDNIWKVRTSQVVIPDLVAAAYREARTTRFEHGEKPPNVWRGEYDHGGESPWSAS